MERYKILLSIILISMCFLFTSCKFSNSQHQQTSFVVVDNDKEVLINAIVVGAEQLALYIPMIANKKCGVVVNQSSLVGQSHLVDTLQQLQVKLERIFVPEHGFRGTADAGAVIKDGKDSNSGLDIVSLYGKNKKPTPEQLKGLEVILFDLQDVGVRCYTYISTLHYVMEACAENNIQLIVLDRPNPNGHVVDGPVLEEAYKSFVGMHQIPFLHGMTIGEYAQMINQEGWLKGEVKVDMEVIPCANYQRDATYELPIKPSPNLPTFRSVLLYPSLVFFEGTNVSIGRGTETPFEHFGNPKWQSEYSFKPQSGSGAKNPKWMGELCFGENLGKVDPQVIRNDGKLYLDYLLKAYERTEDKSSFFLKNNFFDKLAGTAQLREQIIAGKTEEEIRATWDVGLSQFESLRKPYLIY